MSNNFCNLEKYIIIVKNPDKSLFNKPSIKEDISCLKGCSPLRQCDYIES